MFQLVTEQVVIDGKTFTVKTPTASQLLPLMDLAKDDQASPSIIEGLMRVCVTDESGAILGDSVSDMQTLPANVYFKFSRVLMRLADLGNAG